MADGIAALAEFNVQADREGTDPKSYPWTYWKRADGWIVIGPCWPVEYMRQVEKGMIPLRKYGEFHLYNADTKWRVGQDKYRQILQRDGAQEFPVDQIRELGWCCKPPKGVQFPQMEGLEHVHVACGQCKKLFLTTGDLAKHESVTHSTISQQQGLARAMADSINKAQEQGSSPIVDIIKMLAEQQAQQGQILAKLMEKLDTVNKKMT